mmetsp:Transcript_14361/g.35812  ORF Transcript_14361/g.35812 Transcript_14361/m.35812 type:complete len:100 (+) Transcript_14361:1847-2146(+)
MRWIMMRILCYFLQPVQAEVGVGAEVARAAGYAGGLRRRRRSRTGNDYKSKPKPARGGVLDLAKLDPGGRKLRKEAAIFVARTVSIQFRKILKQLESSW